MGGTVQQISFTDPNFLVDSSLALVSMVVIGGMGSVAGAVIGALWVVGLPSLSDNDRSRLASQACASRHEAGQSTSSVRPTASNTRVAPMAMIRR